MAQLNIFFRICVRFRSFDFIVVGTGIAEPILARRLSYNPRWRVLLVEAGPEEPSLTSLPGLSNHTEYTTLDSTALPDTRSEIMELAC